MFRYGKYKLSDYCLIDCYLLRSQSPLIVNNRFGGSPMPTRYSYLYSSIIKYAFTLAVVGNDPNTVPDAESSLVQRFTDIRNRISEDSSSLIFTFLAAEDSERLIFFLRSTAFNWFAGVLNVLRSCSLQSFTCSPI